MAGDLLALPQLSPAQWGASMDYDARPRLRKDGVTLHYVGASKGSQGPLISRGHVMCPPFIRTIERFHISTRGWNGIGYNWFVCPHGTLFRLRGYASGAHNPGDSDRDGITDNVESVGLLLAVSLDEVPTPASLEMARRVIDTVGGYLAPHRTYDCPGNWLRGWINRYKETDVAQFSDEEAKELKRLVASLKSLDPPSSGYFAAEAVKHIRDHPGGGGSGVPQHRHEGGKVIDS